MGGVGLPKSRLKQFGFRVKRELFTYKEELDARVLRLLVKAIPVDGDVKNYLRDENPTTGQVMSFPVPMEFGLINYRAAISQALELGYRGAFLCEHYGGDAITVIGKNRAYIREILATLID
jgi:hypothetical protein